jgi:hypothetical protein
MAKNICSRSTYLIPRGHIEPFVERWQQHADEEGFHLCLLSEDDNMLLYVDSSMKYCTPPLNARGVTTHMLKKHYNI